MHTVGTGKNEKVNRSRCTAGRGQFITGSAVLDYRFPGQWFQFASGLHYNWHRHYDATTGRYVQPDPLGMPDGPSRWTYAVNSPLMRIDPWGLAEPPRNAWWPNGPKAPGHPGHYPYLPAQKDLSNAWRPKRRPKLGSQPISRSWWGFSWVGGQARQRLVPPAGLKVPIERMAERTGMFNIGEENIRTCARPRRKRPLRPICNSRRHRSLGNCCQSSSTQRRSWRTSMLF